LNFSIVNRIRVNNAGYVNDQDYDAADPGGRCAPSSATLCRGVDGAYGETLHGRLARLLRRRRGFTASRPPALRSASM
jgi:hypothetical protein